MLISCQYGDKMTLLNGSSLAGKRCVMFCFGTHLSLGSSDDERRELHLGFYDFGTCGLGFSRFGRNESKLRRLRFIFGFECPDVPFSSLFTIFIQGFFASSFINFK